MIPELENLTPDERALLLKAPALVSVAATGAATTLSEARKADALHLAHLKTFSADPRLRPYYQEAERRFAENLEQALQQYSPYTEENRAALNRQILEVNALLGKLEPGYGLALHHSLSSYATHVKKADRNILENFIFPLPVPGLND